VEITSDFIKESNILDEGTTCYIMRHSSSLVYKLYKGAIEYIARKGEYKLDEKETLNRLNYIVSKREDVSLTDLPREILTCNGKPIGVSINYYANSINLKKYLIENYSEENINLMKQKMLSIVNELIEKGIVPTDPHFENFLVCYNEDGSYKLNMIDTDDQYISIFPNNQRNVWYESEVSACYRIIDLSFEELKKIKRCNI